MFVFQLCRSSLPPFPKIVQGKCSQTTGVVFLKLISTLFLIRRFVVSIIITAAYIFVFTRNNLILIYCVKVDIIRDKYTIINTHYAFYFICICYYAIIEWYKSPFKLIIFYLILSIFQYKIMKKLLSHCF